MTEEKRYTREEMMKLIGEESEELSKTEVMSEKITPDELEDAPVMEYPKLIDKPFVPKKRTFWQKVFGKGKKGYEFNPEIKQPILQLIKDDGYTDWIEGVRAGLFKVKKKGSNEERGIILQPKKLTTLNIPPFPKGWIAYEREMTPYPVDIYHDSGELVGIIRKIEANRNLLKDEAQLISAKMWFWLAIIGAIGLLLYFGFRNNWFASIVGG